MPEKLRSRGWCFTINNPTFDDLERVVDMSVDYMIFAFEKVSTEHIQGYAYFRNQRHVKAIKKMLPRAHLEVQKGTKIEALIYCMKQGEYYEFGDRPHQGRRNDLDAIKYDLLHGKKTMKEISIEYFSQWCQYNRSFDKFLDMHSRYQTDIVMYNKRDIRDLAKIHSYPRAMIIYDNIFLDSYMISEYYSGKHEYIFVPTDIITTEFLRQVGILFLNEI